VLPNLTVFWVIAIVLAVLFILNRLLFKPLGEVMRQREQAIRSARQLADDAAARAAAAKAEFEAKTGVARAEIFREMDERRKAALDYRIEVLQQTREEAEASVADAAARLDAQTAEAKAELEREADRLGNVIVERVLGRPVS
jgi:F-type H+-transporting ATPase subunit b